MKSWTVEQRANRLYAVGGEDQRNAFERDRDRVLYSSAFHRLAGITQVVLSGEEDVFHTRQQHSYKVAQVGRRLAQKLIREQNKEAEQIGLDEEVVEAACLAHDLGHPPFGHIGEKKLDELMRDGGRGGEGFEGNAQSFRVITKLSVRFAQANGLDLTRATLAACLKYPWVRDRKIDKKSKKWSVYASEKKEFEFAREFHRHEHQTTEAHLMDWADDIAYSVHDLEDFHRCRAIPWNEILNDKDRQKLILQEAEKGWYDSPQDAGDKLEAALERLFTLLAPLAPLFTAPYNGEREQRQMLRSFTSQLIGRYVKAARLADCDTGLQIEESMLEEVKLLKQITRDYVIGSPALAAQQHGYGKVIEFLYSTIIAACNADRVPDFIPHRFRYMWELAEGDNVRFTADCISSLTEKEALGLYARLSGSASGSVLDPIVR